MSLRCLAHFPTTPLISIFATDPMSAYDSSLMLFLHFNISIAIHFRWWCHLLTRRISVCCITISLHKSFLGSLPEDVFLLFLYNLLFFMASQPFKHIGCEKGKKTICVAKQRQLVSWSLHENLPNFQKRKASRWNETPWRWSEIMSNVTTLAAAVVIDRPCHLFDHCKWLSFRRSQLESRVFSKHSGPSLLSLGTWLTVSSLEFRPAVQHRKDTKRHEGCTAYSSSNYTLASLSLAEMRDYLQSTTSVRLQNMPSARLGIQSLPSTAISMQHNNTIATHHKWISPSLCVVESFYWLIAIVAELLYCQGQVLTHVQSRLWPCPDPQRLLEPGNKQQRTNFRDKWI